MKIEKALYLIPVNISEQPLEDSLPAGNSLIIKNIQHFIVENLRTARRFLKRIDKDFNIDACEFHELNRHTDLGDVVRWLEPLRKGLPVGVMSEAGCPAVADPGALPVEIAQREGLKVVPLVGPSSILLALMASGFNGQGFLFNGYLPIDETQRSKTIKELESESRRRNLTEIFIETPYRNNRMLKFLSETLHPSTLLCVACDITDPEREYIVTRKAAEWRNCVENFDKRPAIFLIYAGEGAEERDKSTKRRGGNNGR